MLSRGQICNTAMPVGKRLAITGEYLAYASEILICSFHDSVLHYQQKRSLLVMGSSHVERAFGIAWSQATRQGTRTQRIQATSTLNTPRRRSSRVSNEARSLLLHYEYIIQALPASHVLVDIAVVYETTSAVHGLTSTV